MKTSHVHEAYRNILVVEDDPILYKFWGRFLANLPCDNFKVVRSPINALELLETYPANILLTDYSLPQMNGFELVKRAAIKRPRIKTVITSAYLDDNNSVSVEGLFIHIIKKPYKDLLSLREFFLLLMQDADEISDAEIDSEDGFYIWDF